MSSLRHLHGELSVAKLMMDVALISCESFPAEIIVDDIAKSQKFQHPVIPAKVGISGFG
jgi:hypothetical protein